MTNNLALWQTVERTDPRAVKPITGKTYQGNSPKPYWLIQRATEVFGPVGIGWGCTVKSERFQAIGDTDVLHVAVVSIWYVWEGKRSETFDQMGGTKAAYKSNAGKMVVDEDAGKKSVTDGMVKCLSMIGFAGDIFSGRWDDSKYVKEVDAEYRQIEQDAKTGAAPVKDESMFRYLELAEKVISVSRSADDLRRWWREEATNRDLHGITKGTPEYDDLYAAFGERGKALAASHHIETKVA